MLTKMGEAHTRSDVDGCYVVRYQVYAIAHGRSPDDMMAHDEAEYPGGKMTGYIVWVNRKWSDWHAAQIIPRTYCTDADHAAFDLWLVEEYKANFTEIKGE